MDITKTLTLALAMSAAMACQAKLHNVYSRDITSLNGEWQTIVDPFDAGYYDYRLNESKWGFFRNQVARDKRDLLEYDFSDKETLRVPGDWNTQRDELFFYEGSVWYKQDFKKPTVAADGRLYLYFGASNYQTDVYLNGEKLGTHIGGYTPFWFDITDRVQPDNFVVVRVNNVRHPEAVPTVNSDWWNYGGITRDVLLVATPGVYVDDYSLKLSPGRYDELTYSVSLNEPESGKLVELQIPELKIKKQLTTDDAGQASATVKAKPQLWSPESPKLYTVHVICDGDTLTDEIGFRHIATRGREILLNGKPIYLKGISVHEEAPYRTGRCIGEADDSVLVRWAKDMGCNFLRLAHYPHNEAMVRLAEREGMLLWSEIPVYWTIHWDNPATLDNALTQLTDNIARDHNRCAIIIWSIANETPHSDARDRFLSALAKAVRDADDERLVSMAMEVSSKDGNTAYVHDNMSDLVDIVSFNNYLGWYWGTPDDCLTRKWEIPYDKPIFISELGGGAVAGRHGDVDERWTEEYQADLYAKNLAMYSAIPGFAGCSPWILMDFRSPRRQNHETQNFFNRKGLISPDGQKKQAYYVLRDFYNQLEK